MNLQKKLLFIIVLLVAITGIQAQTGEGIPTDYLTKEFHAGRREALRKIMPEHSVAVIFAYPERIFSRDVNFVYHQNPDLYYFSGYNEPNSVLFIFKDMQTAPDHSTYNELFFIQRRDPARELWTGRRMGVDNVKTMLGFDKVYDGDQFNSFPIDFGQFKNILFDDLPEDVDDNPRDTADLFDILKNFKRKAGLPADYSNHVSNALSGLELRVARTGLERSQQFVKQAMSMDDQLKNNALVGEFTQLKDSAQYLEFAKKINSDKFSGSQYNHLVNSLREIKTPEEMDLIRKSIQISCIAHTEVMKAIQPGMSELELQGLHEYIHKRLGSENVGYPSIVGAGDNGCILHYEENTKTNIGTGMVLMDVGAAYHGYSADVTRTVPAKGKYSPEEKQIYDLVYEAQEEVFKLCKDGTPFAELNKKAREILSAGLIKLGIIKDISELGTYYPHGCSHHLGLDVHDRSNYGPLQENMVITVEPGIYIAPNSKCDKKWWGIAVRIEDDVKVGKEKCELLSFMAPRKSEDVEKTVSEKSVINDYIIPKPQTDKKAF